MGRGCDAACDGAGSTGCCEQGGCCLLTAFQYCFLVGLAMQQSCGLVWYHHRHDMEAAGTAEAYKACQHHRLSSLVLCLLCALQADPGAADRLFMSQLLR